MAACVGSMSAERRGALAGPESAAEHVRNALQLLQEFKDVEDWTILEAMEARLVKAVAIFEDERYTRPILFEQPPRGAADATKVAVDEERWVSRYVRK